MSTLCRVPEMRERVLPINFADTREAVATSARSRAAARAHLRAGGCVVMFPAGAVSTARRLFRPAEDADWHPFAARLVLGAEAAVLPVRFEGQNSLVFQLASRISPTLRLSLLMGEARGRIGTTVAAHLGEVLPFAALQRLQDPKELIDHLPPSDPWHPGAARRHVAATGPPPASIRTGLSRRRAQASPRMSSIRIGFFRTRMPVACQIALASAAAVPTMPSSPRPLTPKGLRARRAPRASRPSLPARPRSGPRGTRRSWR